MTQQQNQTGPAKNQANQQQAGDQAKPQAGRQQEQETKQRQQQGSDNMASPGSSHKPSGNKTDQR